MNVELLGYAGAVLMTAMSLPQIARIISDHSAAGVSLLTWCVFVTSGTSWLAYGLLVQAPAVIVGNITFTATTLPVVMLLLMRQRGWATLVAIVVPMLAAALLLIALLALPSAIAGGLGIACGLFTTLPQLLESVARRRERLPSEVSRATLVLMICGMGLWLSYGLARGDLPLILTNVVALSVTITLAAVEFTRQDARA